jgi:hypothetical protein
MTAVVDWGEAELRLTPHVSVLADWYVTFHHKGVIEGRERFVELLDGYTEVIQRRHAAMLEYLAEPHTIDEMVARRFVYRPHV